IQKQSDDKEEEDDVLTYKQKLESTIPRFIDNISFLGQGYNIYFGNPKCSNGLDPGFRNFGVAAFEYNPNPYFSLSRDYSMYVPKGFIATHQQSCTISFSSKTVTSTKDYTDSLHVSASVSVRVGGAFSASADYQQTQSGLSSRETLYIESSARCTAYEIVMQQDPINSANVTPQFAEILRELEAKGDNPDAYYDFFDEIGTHVTDEVELGSLFGYKFQMSTTETQKIVKQNVDVAAAASYMATRARAKTSYEKNQEQQLKTAVSSWTSFSIGAVPDEDNDALKWAARTISNPMPVYVNLVTMKEYLSIYGSAQKIGVSTVQFNNLLNKLDSYLASYCQKRLLVRNNVSSCEDVEIKAPIDVNTVKSNNFIETLFNNKESVVFIQKKSGRFLVSDTNNLKKGESANVYIGNYRGLRREQWNLVRFGFTDSVYQLQHIESKFCLSLRNCNNDEQMPILAKCDQGDICQRFRLQIFNANTQEVIIQSMKSEKVLISDDAKEGNGTITKINGNSDTTSRIWRLQKTLNRFEE
ncbi:MAC/Perforin domain protein, partial [Ichthyophthirius multifiliis]